MTIAAAYLTSNGVVLGADSTTTIGEQGQVAQLLHHAQKVFEIGEHGRMGGCTFGAGRIGNTSHRTLFARLGDWLGDDTTVQAAAERFTEIVNEAASETGGLTSPVGYFLGGRNVGSRLPACCRIYLQPDEAAGVELMQLGEARFEGVPNVFTRVFHGFDPELPKKLLSELIDELRPDFGTALPQTVLVERFNKAFAKVAQGLATVGYKDLPIREAIDFVYAYLHVTIKAYKFRYGAPPCGGPIEIGFITTDRPFRWATHKGFGAAMFEESRG